MLNPPMLPITIPITANIMRRSSGVTTSTIVYISATMPTLSPRDLAFSRFSSIIDEAVLRRYDFRSPPVLEAEIKPSRNSVKAADGDLFFSASSAWRRSIPRSDRSLTIIFAS